MTGGAFRRVGGALIRGKYTGSFDKLRSDSLPRRKSEGPCALVKLSSR